jgi:NADH dehydrogenase
MRLSVPAALVSLGAKLGESIGFDLPINESQIKMLEERNLIENPLNNALITEFDVELTPLAEGLRKLADALPEHLPDEGIGGLKRRHVWVDIVGSPLTAPELFARFRERFSEITPWHMQVGAEPGTSTEPGVGETMTMKLPVRGNIQVRIEELTPTSLTLCTLEGHPLAGAVNFRCRPRDDGSMRFEVRVFDRASNVADWLVMSTVGGHIQRETWKSIAEKVVEESGGTSIDGVHHESDTLTGDDAEPLEEWMKGLVMRRKREERAAASR